MAAAFRPALRLLPRGRPCLPRLSISRPRFASELPNLPPGLESSPLFQKIRSAPAVLESVSRITELFQKKGIAMDRKPSFTEMMTLARDTELQDAMRGLKKAMDESGISVDIQELLKSMPPNK